MVALAIAGCSLTPSATRVAIGSGKKPATAASTKPVKAAASPSAAPTGPMRLVQGTVRIDAHYILSNAAGSLISNNGLSLISDAGGGLISDAGGGLMVVDGKSIAIGAGIVSNAGAGIVVSGRTRYGLSATPAVAVGEVLPVEGMGVVALSLITGQPISVAVRSDKQGGFKLEVPEAIAENIRLVAKVPTAKADDPLQRDRRLEYGLVLSPAGTDAREFNEDTRVASRFLRESALDKGTFLLGGTELDNDAHFTDPSLSGPVQALVLQMAKEFRQAVKDAQVPASAMPSLVQRVLDVALAYVDLQTIVIDPNNTVWRSAPANAKAIPVLAETLAELRMAAAAKMAANPAYFDGKPYMESANTRRLSLGLSAYTIKRPSDFVDFIFDEYVADNSIRYDRIGIVLDDLGLTAQEDGQHLVKSKLSAGGKSIFLKLFMTMMTRPEVKTEIMAQIKAAGKP